MLKYGDGIGAKAVMLALRGVPSPKLRKPGELQAVRRGDDGQRVCTKTLDNMTRKILLIISIVCLALTIVPSFLVFAQVIDMGQNKTLMLLGTAGWFITAPYWMRKQ